QLVATATYSDGTSSDISSSVTWTPADPATATVTPAGLLSGVAEGSTTLTASEGGKTSNTVNVTVTDAVIDSIQVTPSPVNIAKGQKQQLVATATYSDDTSSDISSSVTWTPADPATATVTPAGLLSGVAVGGTTLTASEGGKTSNTVDVDVNVLCSLADTCIDIVDITNGDGTGKLFTNSPSVAYLDSVGGSATADGSYHQIGITGPVGDFYLFDRNNANTLCNTYSTNSIGGRTNWRLATKDELLNELYGKFGNMFTARGWPAYTYYWSATPTGSSYYVVGLYDGLVTTNYPYYTTYVSCVSNP
ncbi:hypothetical protein G3496_21280, partial [Shewanella baltica]|uniref:Ig-like domain-containing protein n=1 Tax=Shewanella baltica TaxID=62322 RepID=UPI00217E3588